MIQSDRTNVQSKLPFDSRRVSLPMLKSTFFNGLSNLDSYSQQNITKECMTLVD